MIVRNRLAEGLQSLIQALRSALVQADLTVSGTGTAGGTLHIDGTFSAPGPVGNFKVSGTLGGKQVAVLVPEG
jgi:hypothetical protein